MLAGKVAWVTGATGGVGPGIVQGLAEAGATIVATGRHEDTLAKLAAETGVPAERWLAQPADLGDPGAAEAVVRAAVDRFGGIDILVAVAGGWRGGTPVAETSPETLEWLWRTNLLTAFSAMRAALPVMLSRHWGRMITMAARSALGGQARSGPYAASKAAVLALTQSVALETKGQGITANTLLIGTADTPANRAAMPNADRSRWVTPVQIAATVRFLCSEEASIISGAAIPM